MTARLMTIKQVCERVALSRPAVYAAMARGDFPRPIKVTSHAVRWPVEEVEQWLASRPRATGIDRSAA